MLYAPLRTMIYIDSGDRTRFAVDQPSTVFAGFAGFADPAIAGLGTGLDRQLAALLEALGVEANQVLGAADPAGATSVWCSSSLPLCTARRGWY